MRKIANLSSIKFAFAFVVSCVLGFAGGLPQALAGELPPCPSSPAYTPDFSSNQSCLTLNSYSMSGAGTGSTIFTGENPVVLQLTANSTNQTGSAWYTTPQVVQNGFTTNFQFQFTPAGGADGIAFVIQNAGTSAIGFTGGNGGALGYGDADVSTNPSTGAGIPYSLAIEFDVYQNSWDPAGSHVAVQSCGAGPNTSHHGQACSGNGTNSTLGAPVVTSTNFADGAVHTVTIKYSAASPANIHVILDGTDLYPNGVNVDLSSILGEGETAYVGFTGATGAVTETQSILSWTFSPTSSNPETTFTTQPQTTTAGGSNQFTDPGGSGTNQTYQFPTTTQFLQDDNTTCSSPTMAIQFQYWDPTVFDSSRLPGIPQNPNWCTVSGTAGLACTTPVPAGTQCVPVVTTSGPKCIVEEAQCSCGGTPLAQCNVTAGALKAGASGILVSNANNNYASPPTNPGLVIGDDGQNNWAIMPQAPDGSTCTTNCSTQKLNTDITILDVDQPDFSFAVSSPSLPLTLGVGASAMLTVTVSPLNNFNLLANSSVALSLTNSPPVGISTGSGFSPASFASLSSPESSTLTVTAAPYVTPTSFTLDALGTNTSLSLNHFAFVTVNLVASTSSITNVITSLLNAGCIDNAGIANALTSKLSAAQGYINAGDNLDAINTLTAFNNQVNAQNGKHIHLSCSIVPAPGTPASVLIADAQSLTVSLRVGMIADPITGYVLDATTGVGISGATVSITSGATTVVTATTDLTGFYYFATTNVLTSGSTYSIAATAATYTSSAPTSFGFTWSGTGFSSNFTLGH